ncbi:MAG: hypothetical protein LBM65_01445 [Oscillospiraceae bacterium]|jgi:hypothetical protein|nr:hypothetical protein [Oscillospiraceae bacterium]
MQKKLNKRTKDLILASVALVQVLLIFAMSTFAWLQSQKDADVYNDKEFILNADTGLEIDFGDNTSDGNIVISDMTLWQASSVDGRNIFFPTNDTTGNYDNMTFREGNASDVNSKYVIRDFKLSGGGTGCSIYIDETNTDITQDGNVLGAVRVAFWDNDSENPPIVFAPVTKEGANDCVKSIDPATGKKNELEASSLRVFADFGAGDTPMFSLSDDETKNITMIIWLEGTDDLCTESIVGDLDLKISLTTTVPNAIKFYFEDDTYTGFIESNWIPDRLSEMYVKVGTLSEATSETGIMYHMTYLTNHKWVATVPLEQLQVTNEQGEVTYKGVNFISKSLPGKTVFNDVWHAGVHHAFNPARTEYTYIAEWNQKVDQDNPAGSRGKGRWKDDPLIFKPDDPSTYTSIYFSKNEGFVHTGDDFKKDIYDPRIYYLENNYDYIGFPVTYSEEIGSVVVPERVAMYEDDNNWRKGNWVGEGDANSQIFEFKVPIGITEGFVIFSKTYYGTFQIEVSSEVLAAIRNGTNVNKKDELLNGFYRTGEKTYGMYPYTP